MINTIISMLGGLFGSVSKVMDYFSKKDTENTIRKGYEEEKRADTLEEDKVATETVKKSKAKSKAVKEDLEAIKNLDMSDADKSDEEIEMVIATIEDPEAKVKKTKSVKAAKEVKARKTRTKKVITESKAFNDGEEITFKG